MKINEGGIDRILRVVIGAGLLVAAYVSGIWWLWPIGGILLLTGAIGWCGIYTLFGWTTNKK